MNAVISSLPSLAKETTKEWLNDNAMRLAAALAYYTVFSLAPMVLAAIAISGMVYGEEAAAGKIYVELKSAIGPSAAGAVEELANAAAKPATSILSTLLALALALFGASGVFGELKESLNQIWGVKPPEGGGVMAWIRGRFLSIGMVMGVCFLLLVSMGVSAFLTTLSSRGLSSNTAGTVVLAILNQVISMGVVTVLFSAMFRYLPATRIAWRDVWVGGAVTAVLFNFGKFGLEQYVARAAPASSFGAASALALILVWVYYSAQIFLFGAEFTEVYSRRHGSRKSRQAPRHMDKHQEPESEAAQAAPADDASFLAGPGEQKFSGNGALLLGGATILLTALMKNVRGRR